MEAVKGSQLDRCRYPLSGLPGEPPSVRAPLQLHHRCLGQHSPVHFSAVMRDPWRPDSHLPTPVPPPFPKGAVTWVLCPLAPPPAYVDSSTAAPVNNPGRPGGRATLSVSRGPSDHAANPPWDAAQP